MNESLPVIILILVLLLMMALAFLGSRFLMKRALFRVIKMFRDARALDPASARTQEELGFRVRGLLEFRALRDYKPAALQILIRNDIVRVTEDGRLYLSEERLALTNLAQQDSRR